MFLETPLERLKVIKCQFLHIIRIAQKRNLKTKFVYGVILCSIAPWDAISFHILLEMVIKISFDFYSAFRNFASFKACGKSSSIVLKVTVSYFIYFFLGEREKKYLGKVIPASISKSLSWEEICQTQRIEA